jgi:TIR domain/Nucleoside 2-deoxyribosyltransferase
MSKRSLFISYSRRDADLANSVADALERLGFNALDPGRELQPGDDWRKAIQTAIKRSDAVVLVASPQSSASSWSHYEVGIAEGLGKTVMVLLPNTHSVTELPADIASNPIVELDPKAPDRAAQDIVARLAAA